LQRRIITEDEAAPLDNLSNEVQAVSENARAELISSPQANEVRSRLMSILFK
jgi:hypothetical protein